MPTAIGVIGGFLGLAEESVYGTPVAATRFLYINGESIRATENKAYSPAIAKVSRQAARNVQGRVDVGGDFTFNPGLSYHGFTMLLKHLLGTVATATPDSTAAPTVRRHTFTPADALPAGLTLEVGKDLLSHRFEGCKVTSMRFSGSQGELLAVTAGILGQDVASIADSAPVLTEGNIPNCTNATLSWGGTNLDVTNFDLAIENPIAPRFFIDSRFTDEPARAGQRRVSGTFTTELQDATLWSDWRNQTRRQIILTVTGASIAGGYSFDVQFTLPVTELMEGQAQLDAEGVLTIPVAFESFADASNANEVSIRVTNENVAAV